MARVEPQALPQVEPEWQEAVQRAESLVDEPPQIRGGGWRLIPAWRYALAAAAAVVLLAVGLFWNEGRNSSPPVRDQAQAPVTAPSPAPAPPEEPTMLAQQSPPSPSGRPQEPKPQVRQAPGTTESSLKILWPQEGQQLARDGLEIRWQELAGAHLYEVSVLDRSGDVVWEGQAQSTRVGIPDEVKLRAGERYFVWVLAHVQGNGAMRSPAVAFEIRASATR